MTPRHGSEAQRDPLGFGRRLKQALMSGERCAGAILKIPSPDMVEVLGGTGLDFVIADAEHGPITPETCQQMVRAGDAVGIPVLVRIGETSVPGTVTRFLDTGVAGVQLPHVNSAEVAKASVELLFHPSGGSRGLAGGRWARYGTVAPLPELVGKLPTSLVLVAQIEDELAVGNLDELLLLEEPDAFFIGPTDLAASMGYKGDRRNPSVVSAVDETLARIMEAGRPAGILASDPEEAERYAAAGVRYFVFNGERLAQAGAADVLAALDRGVTK
jgi:2-keto-3-deoxy-L-rhamnonate aldolase RhmA